MIQLYGMSSPNVRKIALALEEMALDYRPHHVAVFRGDQFAPEFLALNPMAKVPVIVDAGGPAGTEPIFESGAILIYLAENYGREFLPETGPQRYAALKWLMMQVASAGPMLGNHSHFRLQAKGNEYAAKRFRHMAAQVWRAVECRLGEAEWLGGDSYTIADMAMYPWARYLTRHGMEAAEFPRLTAWAQRISARPAAMRADVVIRSFAEQDSADRAAATPQQRAMLIGLHIDAPSEQAAASKKRKRRRCRWFA